MGKTAYVFDVDGVITNINTQDVQETAIINEISNRLTSNSPIALITGRSFAWLDEKVLSLMSGINKDNLFVSCEFAGVIVNYKNNSPEKNINKNVRIPDNFIKQALAISQEYNSVVYEGKETFLTFRKKTEASLSDFQNAQKDFGIKLSELISIENLSNEFNVHTDMLGINVRHKDINKHLAIREFIKWLDSNKITAENYLVFGDSISDFEMGDELHKQKLDFKFIFVGENLGDLEYDFPIINTVKHYDKGTLEYLNQE